MQTSQIKKAVWAMLLAAGTTLSFHPAHAQRGGGHFGGGPWGGGHFGGPGGGWHGGGPGGWGGGPWGWGGGYGWGWGYPYAYGATVVMAAGVRIGGILTGTPIGPVGAGGGPCLMPMVA
ncbi:hypothetical protein [Acetobacter okinawensis]|uniref:hypothetical protein n=1 Tax=Acetobacter okinawensis TaxID=1076594 RepID=UPI000B1A19A2|nr:hypothetical protein [Acetobacter okinawensis]